MVEDDDRDFRKAQLLRGQQPPAARQNPGLAVHQNRIREAKLGDGGGHMSHLHF